MSRRPPRSPVALPLALAFAGLAACAPASEPYDLPAARLDPAAVVRLGEGAAPPTTAASPGRATSFEERLRRSRG
ncbi:MAG TPA: hypothetical protein VF100_04930, partial [Thermoanaerobaculia bacterium]